MKNHIQSKRVQKTGLWQLMKYASLSIIVLGFVSIIAFRSAGGAGDVEVHAGEGDEEIFGLVDNTLLDSTPEYIQTASVAMNDEGTIITAYTKKDYRLVIEYGLYTRICRSGVWENPVVIFGYEDVTGILQGIDHQVTINEPGQAGVVYKLGEDQRQGDPKFRVAYFDGSTWNYNISIEGDPYGLHYRIKFMEMDSNGVLYVTYQILNPDYSCDLVVARFNETGLVDKTHFPNNCGASVLLCINKKDEVMVLQNNIGSRIFNGTIWGELVPLNWGVDVARYLKFYDSGKADFVRGYTHYHYNGLSWETGYEIIDMYEYAEQASVAASNNGAIMLAYTTRDSPSRDPMVKARFFNGRVWGPITTLLDDGIWSENPRVLVDGKGRFAVIHDVIVAYGFDGTWHEQVILDGAWGVLEPAMAMNENGDFTIINCAGMNVNLYGMRFFFRPTGIITLLTPNGGETIPSGSTYTVQWDAVTQAVSFELKYSTNKGKTWKLIESDISDSTYDWTVPVPDKNLQKCLVEVTGFDITGKKVGEDKSDAPFAIEVLTLGTPNGGEVIASGSSYDVSWNTNDTKSPVYHIKLFCSTKGGKKWKLMATELGNPGISTCVFPIPKKNMTNCLIKAVAYDSTGAKVAQDQSDGPFTIEVLRVISPNGGETVSGGDVVSIDWETHQTIKAVAKVVLKYSFKGGKKWKKIETITGDNPGTYLFTVPEVTKTRAKCKVGVQLKNKKGKSIGSDTSDSYFTVQP